MCPWRPTALVCLSILVIPAVCWSSCANLLAEQCAIVVKMVAAAYIVFSKAFLRCVNSMLRCMCCVQAVAGMVGHAELLCAALSLPAVLLYMSAVDGKYAAARQLASLQHPPGNIHSGQSTPTNMHTESVLRNAVATDAYQHWLLVMAAVALIWAAALSKEIGITVAGTMMVYDVLLSQPTCSAHHSRRQLMRILFIALSGIAYIKLRSWVAVDQLVRIYRKVSARSQATALWLLVAF